MEPDGDTDTKILKAVEEHYHVSPSEPYYASELGNFIRARNLHLPPDVSVVNYIRSKFENKLFIVQDPQVRARIAVALPQNRDDIERLISRRGSVEEAPETEFRRLPFALIAAFCRRPDGKRVFFSTKPPFRYQLSDMPPSENFVEIEPEYQLSEAQGINVHALSEEQRLSIYRSIAQWANAKALKLSSFYIGHRGIEGGQKTIAPHAARNALERLIAVQDDDVRPRINMPLDIAQLLMSYP